LVGLIAEKCGINLSESSVGLCIKRRCLYSRKRVRTFVEKDGLAEKKSYFARQLGELSQHDVLSVDETGIWFDMKPSYGYSKRGQRLRRPVSNYKQTKYTLIMAVSCDEVVHTKLVKGACNGSIFATFIRELPVCCNGKRILIDNAAFHKTSAVRAALDDSNIEAVYLSAYSPEFQPIESVFSSLKFWLRRCNADDSSDDREESIATRVATVCCLITPTQLQRTFAHCWRVAQTYLKTSPLSGAEATQYGCMHGGQSSATGCQTSSETSHQ
jgi:transposase